MAQIKDPQAVKDYGFIWAPWLGSDTITASTWASDNGITINSSSFTTTTTTVWLSGGTEGLVYNIVNHITTAGGRQDDRTLVVQVVSQ